MRLKLIDECPCPRRLYPVLVKLKRDTGCEFQSIYRGDDAAKLLHRHGKHTQRELYEGYRAGRPGYNPANPPDRGTHILLGDGVVGRLHEKLDWWQVGLDIDDAHTDDVIRAAARQGWEVYRPYAGSSEYHHLNFRRKPRRWRLWFKRILGRRAK